MLRKDRSLLMGQELSWMDRAWGKSHFLLCVHSQESGDKCNSLCFISITPVQGFSLEMVFFTCSGAVTSNVQCFLLNLYNFQCLPIRSDINTRSYCCSTESLVMLAQRRLLYQKPQVPSWLSISLQLWSSEVWSWEAWPVTSSAGEPSGILPCIISFSSLAKWKCHFRGTLFILKE